MSYPKPTQTYPHLTKINSNQQKSTKIYKSEWLIMTDNDCINKFTKIHKNSHFIGHLKDIWNLGGKRSKKEQIQRYKKRTAKGQVKKWDKVGIKYTTSDTFKYFFTNLIKTSDYIWLYQFFTNLIKKVDSRLIVGE